MEKNRPTQPPPAEDSEKEQGSREPVGGKDQRERASADAGREAPHASSERPIETSGSEYGFIPWVLVAGVGFMVAWVLLKRVLFRLIPMFFVMFVFLTVLYYLYRKYMYRDIEDVEEEYSPLMALLKTEGMQTYQKILGTAWKNLKSARDRADRVREGLRRGDIPALQARLRAARAEHMIESDPTMKAGLEKTIREQEENLQSLLALRNFLKKFEQGKKQLAESCRNLRLKIEMKQLSREVGGAAPSDEIDGIISEIEKLTFIVEKVDG